MSDGAIRNAGIAENQVEPRSLRGSFPLSSQDIVEDTLTNYRRFINPSLALLMRVFSGGRVEARGQGVYVEDTEGRRYIDCLAGFGSISCGHAHPKIVAAVMEQLQLLPASTKVFFNKPLADLSKLLAEITPGDLQYSFICNSGAEAVEGALKLAKLFTKRTEIVFMEGAFHGKTLGALSVSGRNLYKQPFKPLLPHVRQVPFGDIEALTTAVTPNTAAVLLEPIQGEGGVNLSPEGYLQAAQAICQEAGALLIFDEVQTGFGRTGTLFECQQEGIVPDILVLAKALGGGVMPIGAFVATPRVWKAFKRHPLLHTSTFGGNPLACRAAVATIRVILEEKLPDRAQKLGKIFISELEAIRRRFPRIIAAVRGKGLLIGVELQKEGYGLTIFPEMVRRGVIAAFTLNNPKVIRFEPPLVITEDQIRQVIQVFEHAVKKADGLRGRLASVAFKIGQIAGLVEL
ncbi:MAG: aspartate aminotransferase family protein [Candidatus Omnitrophica bacterium]|nr:aspartate aminotransferase family protein [Candidatus Omnitrophota bacterium]